jgi:hypothetical protein
MRYRFLLISLSFLFVFGVYAQNKINLPVSFGQLISQKLKPFFSPSEGEREDLLKGEVISTGKVHSPTKKEQQMFLFVAGVHPRNCTRAMRKLSLYENYKNYMDFIKSSQYDEISQKFSFTIDHTLLPFPMIVKFKIPEQTDKNYEKEIQMIKSLGVEETDENIKNTLLGFNGHLNLSLRALLCKKVINVE